MAMASLDDLISSMRDNPQSVRFADLEKVCDSLFGEARQKATSHSVYKTPWQGEKLLEGPDAQLVFVILHCAGKEVIKKKA